MIQKFLGEVMQSTSFTGSMSLHRGAVFWYCRSMGPPVFGCQDSCEKERKVSFLKFLSVLAATILEIWLWVNCAVFSCI